MRRSLQLALLILSQDLVSLPNVAVGVRDVDRLPTMTFKAGMTCEPSYDATTALGGVT